MAEREYPEGMPPETPPAGVPPETPPAGVTPEDLAALRAELEGLRPLKDYLQPLQQELEQLRTNWGRVQEVFAPQTSPNPNTEFYLNPQSAIQRSAQELEARIMQRVTTQQQQQAWWGDFYKANTDLDNDVGHDLVRLTILRSPAIQQAGFDAKSAKLLAEETRKLALSVSQRFGAGGGAESPVRMVEAGGGTRSEAPRSSPPPARGQEPATITQLIRAQRQARQRRAASDS